MGSRTRVRNLSWDWVLAGSLARVEEMQLVTCTRSCSTQTNKNKKKQRDRLRCLSSSSPLLPALKLRHLLPNGSQDSGGASTHGCTPSSGAGSGPGFYDEVEATGSIRSLSKTVEKDGSIFYSVSYEEVEMDADVNFVHSVSTEMDEEFLAQLPSPEENIGFLVIGGRKIYILRIS
ncbi:Hypothetical predicted protein [Olea europaea subsp. europaea]|uniref:Uncharacterized protein n=1 Tax=Olea europaea subsp. europaea TaxID=158383 RepID=A0A8S0V1N2_OLEEU|nr:Hypothetical predicted protein [Olea europaea subsp. europaea]